VVISLIVAMNKPLRKRYQETMKKLPTSLILLLLIGCSTPRRPSTSEIKGAITPNIPTPSLITPSKPDLIWTLSQGSTLKSALMQWIKQPDAQCAPSTTGYWTLHWNTRGVNYPIDAELRFTGSFQQAITALFELYRDAEKPLYVRGYEHQCLIIVSDTL
jgi:Toxin co-regulated pilus biosynthesis protein Q